jgi:nucleoside-diphosphate-sugar epimerase
MSCESAVRLLLEDGELASRHAGLHRLEGARLLITGASGIIGLNLLAALAAARAAGVSMDIYASVQRPPSDALNRVAHAAGAIVVASDLSTPQGVEDLPIADIIVHAAGSGDPGVFLARKAETLSIGACATLALIRRLPPNGRLLFLSSSEVYQGLDGRIADESLCGTTTPQHPRAAYIEAKRAGEAACVVGREAGLTTTVARIAITYGPGARLGDTRVVNALIERSLRQPTTQLLDSGAAIRTLIYTRDAVELLWRIALQGRESIYNVAGKTVVTVKEMAEIVAGATHSRLESGRGDGAAGAAREVRLDLTRVLTEFPKTDFLDLEGGIARTVEWYRSLLEVDARA